MGNGIYMYAHVVRGVEGGRGGIVNAAQQGCFCAVRQVNSSTRVRRREGEKNNVRVCVYVYVCVYIMAYLSDSRCRSTELSAVTHFTEIVGIRV